MVLKIHEIDKYNLICIAYFFSFQCYHSFSFKKTEFLDNCNGNISKSELVLKENQMVREIKKSCETLGQGGGCVVRSIIASGRFPRALR